MAGRIADEIRRKRKKPAAVYFCPSCDPFQPIPQIQQVTFEVMKTLLENDIGVQFVTKGKMPEEIFALFEKYHSKILLWLKIDWMDRYSSSIIVHLTVLVGK